jgi:hypothetical protein
MNVAKLDWNVAYVATVVHLCCKHLSPLFHMFFQTYVASVFIWKLHMFHAYVANVFIWMLHMCCKVFQVFSCVFTSVSDTCFKYFICFQTYVTFVASRCFKTRSSVASPSSPLCCLTSMKRGKGEAVPTSVGRALWACGRSRRDVGG